MDKLTFGKLEYRMTEHLFLISKAVNVYSKYMYRQNIYFTYVPPHRYLSVWFIYTFFFTLMILKSWTLRC